MSGNPFDWLNSINITKKDLIEEGASESAYIPFMINRGLSYFPDTILHASEMDRMAHLDKKMQYDYYMHEVRKKKRFAKWAKAVNTEDLKIISKAYKYNLRRATEALAILSKDQIAALKERYKGDE